MSYICGEIALIIQYLTIMEDVQKVYDFINRAQHFYLATMDGDQPRVRVYGASLLYEGKLYFMAIKGSNAPDQLAKNPKFEICTFKNNVLRMTGKLVLDDRTEVKQALIKKIPPLGESIGEEGMLMYYVTDATATFYNLRGVTEVIKF